MLNLAWAQIRSHPTRHLAVLLAVVLGTLFLAATSVFSSTSEAGLRAVAAAPLTAADVVVDRDPETADPGSDWPSAVAEHPDVETVTEVHARTVQVATDDLRGTANVHGLADDPGLRWFDLAEGDWPVGTDEVVADSDTLESLGLRVGDTVRFTGSPADAEAVPGGGTEGTRDGEGLRSSGEHVTVTGSVALDFQPLTGVRFTFYAPEVYFAGDSPLTVLASTAPGVSPETAVTSLEAALPPDLYVMTAEDQARLAADRFAGGSQQLDLLLLACALMALLAAAMVIANTFTILLTQRRRDTALLRLVGADRGQVRALVVAEALIIGGVGSLVGLGAGIAVGYAGASLTGLAGAGPHLDPLLLAGCALVGVGTTVAAAWAPARTAAGTAPVEALRSAPLDGAVRFRAVHALGTVCALLGLGAMVAGARVESLPLALGGGFAGAVGVLMALRYPISRLLRLAHRPLRRMGGVADLAGANLRRDTGRAATATLALVLGLGLISALTTAAATGRATIDGDLNSRYPVDVSARVDEGSVAAGTVERVREIEGLAYVESPRTAQMVVEGLDRVTVVGVSPRLAEVTGAETLLGSAGNTDTDTGFDPGGHPVMLVSGDQLEALGVEPGESVELGVDGTARGFTVYPSALATASGTAAPVVLAEVLEDLARESTRGMVWGVAAPGIDRDHLADQMDLVAGADPEVSLSGALSERGDLTEVLDLLVALALVMLLVTVVISGLGVANTLSLSVLERTREVALLRALGLSRAGLYGTLAVEAVVVCQLGAVLGVLLGVPFGLVGVDAIVGGTAPLEVAVPWSALGLVLASALGVGVLATLVPAARAARVAPAEGLTHG
ncbi:FtsX-like permease family protein [Nocardiopsis eucommiae]|uniref:FtsX-like permease family protein n=1 Tax=Nocardiopsis eucommiae TaxID=2831970 RepID=UPI003D7214EF